MEAMIQSACVVGERWSWHRDFPALIQKARVDQRLATKQRRLPLLIRYDWSSSALCLEFFGVISGVASFLCLDPANWQAL